MAVQKNMAQLYQYYICVSKNINDIGCIVISAVFCNTNKYKIFNWTNILKCYTGKMVRIHHEPKSPFFISKLCEFIQSNTFLQGLYQYVRPTWQETVAPPAVESVDYTKFGTTPPNSVAITKDVSEADDKARYNTTQHNTTQHNTTQHNTTQHNTTQHNTTQHNTTQHNTQVCRKL